ncbi:MAG: hypothetical protein N2554_08865, partial [Fimbriimonadales bacterium]|nr:hypothetical protein [Fimbriimonadales bacterium]
MSIKPVLQEPPQPQPDGLLATPTIERARGLRLRGLLIGFALLPFTTYWAVEIVLSVIFSLMIPPVATLMVVALLNAIGRLIFRRWLLETPDLVVIFTILFVGTAMAAEWMNVCVPLWHSFGLYAENNDTYRNRVLPHLTSWLFHTEAAPIREYGIGGYKFPYALTKLSVWLPIFLGWMGLFGSATLAMLCINTLMR